MVATQPEQKKEEKPKRVVSRRPEVFDVLFDSAMSIQSKNRRMGAAIALRMNARGARPIWFTGRSADVTFDAGTIDRVAAVLVDSERLTDEEKWAFASEMQQRERVWSRIFGIIGMLDRDALNMIATSSYLIDEYVAGEAERRIGRITGHIHRWLEKFCSDNMLMEAECAVAPLAAGRSGRAALGTKANGQGFVISQFDSEQG